MRVFPFSSEASRFHLPACFGWVALFVIAWLAVFLNATPVRAADADQSWGFSPVPNGRVSSPFGWRQDPLTGQARFHAGLDIAADAGTPIYVPLQGVVVYAGPYQGYGNVVVVRHTATLYTLYGHAMATLVQAGQPLTAGDPIALVGSTGRSTGPHLHFEVRQPDGFVNPTDFLASLQQNADQTRVAGRGWREIRPMQAVNPFVAAAPVPPRDGKKGATPISPIPPGVGGPEVANGESPPVPMGPPPGPGRAVQVIRGNQVEWSRF